MLCGAKTALVGGLRLLADAAVARACTLQPCVRACMQHSRGMAGHSKWKTIKHTKMANDMAKSKQFGKIAREISSAVRENGPNPKENLRLSSIMARGRKLEMPLARMESAIKAAISNKEVDNAESQIFEGRGPGGVAMLIQTLTDNKRRTNQELKATFAREPTAALSGGVLWMFDRKGVLVIAAPAGGAALPTGEGLLELALEVEAEEIEEGEPASDGSRTVDVVCDATAVAQVRQRCEAKGFVVQSAAIEYLAKEHVTLSGADLEAYEAFEERVLDVGDVMEVYSNLRTAPDAA